MSPARPDRTWFLLLALFAFGYIIARLALVPPVHDEARLYLQWNLPGSFLPYLSHWDAGNHLLCTALGQLSISLFGHRLWALRLFSALSFVPYVAYTWRWGQWLADRWTRWCFWVAMLLMPWVIEYFGLYRGYGMGMALLLMASYHTAAAVQQAARPHFLAALLAWALASAAMLTLSLLWSAALALLFGAVLMRALSTMDRAVLLSAWLVLGVVPLLGALRYGHDLQERGLLYFGTDSGLVRGTLGSVTNCAFGSDAFWLVWPLVAAVVWAAMTGARSMERLERMRFAAGPFTVLAILVIAEVFGRLVLGWAGVLYPKARTAMHWMPMMVLLLAFAFDRAAMRTPMMRWGVAVLLLLPLRTLATMNLGYTTDWPEQAIGRDMLEGVRLRQAKSARPLLIGASPAQLPQWDLSRLLWEPTLPLLSSTGFPSASSDLLLIDPSYDEAPAGFRTIVKNASGRLLLLERFAPMELTTVLDSTIPAAALRNSHTWWEPVVAKWSGRALVVDVAFSLRSTAQCLHAAVVFDVVNRKDEHVPYDQVELSTLRRDWNGEPVRISRRLPVITDDIERIVVYCWDIDEQGIELGDTRLRIMEAPLNNTP